MPASRSISLRSPLIVDRYAIYGEIASGGMATVHFARLSGAHGFSRTVAAKRLLPHLGRDREFSLMLIDEARLAARIHHPNVVSTLDVVQTDAELVLVMDYVHGESVAKLARSLLDRGESVPFAIALAILIDTLHGLHAAHEAKDEQGAPLGIVHRDISPHNLLVATDGVTRIVDFGVAKAAGRSQVTQEGAVKGKLAYMAPEQINLDEVTRQSDIFAASVVLWELLTGARLFSGTNAGQIVHQVMSAQIPQASSVAPHVPKELDAILARGLSANAADRYATALDMARALEACAPHIRPTEIGAWVSEVAAEALDRRARLRAAVEQDVPEPRGTETAVHQVDVNAAAKPQANAGSPFSAAPRVNSANTPAPSVAHSPSARPLAEPGIGTDTSAVTASAAPRPEQRRNKIGIAVAVALLVALVSVFLYVWTQRSEAAWAAARASDSAPLPVPQVEPKPAPALDRAASISSASASSAMPAAASAQPAEASRARKFTPAKGHASPAVPPAVRARADECDPPYSIDAAGRHIFKVQCM